MGPCSIPHSGVVSLGLITQLSELTLFVCDMGILIGLWSALAKLITMGCGMCAVKSQDSLIIISTRKNHGN